MFEIGLYLAALVGVASLWLRNWTALPLLASFALVTAMCRYEVDFNPLYWMAIDIAVFVAILVIAVLRSRWLYSDAAILALFVPAAIAPLFAPELRDAILWAVVVSQFLLTFQPDRAAEFWRRASKFNRTFDPWDGLRRIAA